MADHGTERLINVKVFFTLLKILSVFTPNICFIKHCHNFHLVLIEMNKSTVSYAGRTESENIPCLIL